MKNSNSRHMVKRTFAGRVVPGCGNASTWEISEIRKATGNYQLVEGTLNLELEVPHILRPDHKLVRENRKDRHDHDEDLFFEHCVLVIGTSRVRALIARTSTNYWGPSVLEVMAEEMLRRRYSLEDGDVLDVEVWVESMETK
jgi:CTP-dependent riboflavin kinase